LYVHAAWIGCGLLAIVTIILLRLRPVPGYVSLVVLTVSYAPASFAVWHHSILLHHWLSLAAIALATYGVFVNQRHVQLERG
ncbi:hypothetical protein, partial [Dyella silvatica]|uniref:hypothetical protein n=1 Tax=Dyella silvatica TaxID=2992128 RepID=UPI003CCD553F